MAENFNVFVSRSILMELSTPITLNNFEDEFAISISSKVSNKLTLQLCGNAHLQLIFSKVYSIRKIRNLQKQDSKSKTVLIIQLCLLCYLTIH